MCLFGTWKRVSSVKPRIVVICWHALNAVCAVLFVRPRYRYSSIYNWASMNLPEKMLRRRIMHNQKKLIVSHAPFWHDGDSLSARHYNIFLAALIPVIAGCITYGVLAVGVVSLSVSSAIIWEI